MSRSVRTLSNHKCGCQGCSWSTSMRAGVVRYTHIEDTGACQGNSQVCPSPTLCCSCGRKVTAPHSARQIRLYTSPSGPGSGPSMTMFSSMIQCEPGHADGDQLTAAQNPHGGCGHGVHRWRHAGFGVGGAHEVHEHLIAHPLTQLVTASPALPPRSSAAGEVRGCPADVGGAPAGLDLTAGTIEICPSTSMSLEATIPPPTYNATCPAREPVDQNSNAPGGGLRSASCRNWVGITVVY